ncbi:conjugal transfer protein TraX [Paenibacillus popilliae]|uniref:conjugal transfer protein TraX n=1 Tax=Paenibacillus popilliae TaxID=78057 RepID=UPI0021B03E09|nr:conjugal transfer protein TraX [Paenibacillus sp. SDF0028]
MRLDGFKLKLLGMTLMLLDHMKQFLPDMPIWFGWLGRIVAPIFFYFIVEGVVIMPSGPSICSMYSIQRIFGFYIQSECSFEDKGIGLSPP